MSDLQQYALGSSDAEHERLMVQAEFLRPWTDRYLRAGGLERGHVGARPGVGSR